MLISGSGVVNRYIAAQGPLPETSADFWQMVWEQRSTLVVMLTTIMERGRVKCHKYWPDLNTSAHYGDLVVTCHRHNGVATLVKVQAAQHHCRPFLVCWFIYERERYNDHVPSVTDHRRRPHLLCWPIHSCFATKLHGK